MNSLIESLNMWGGRFYDFALPILWQSSLLIAVVFAVDFLLRRKIRSAVRYTLWFVVFIKLLIPPTLALPTSAAWWLRTRPVHMAAPQTRTMTVSYSEPVATFVSQHTPVAHYSPPPPRLSREAGIFLASLFVSALLGAWSVFRWRQIARCVGSTTAATGEIQDMFAEIRSRAGVRKTVRLQLTADSMSPAVCGLFRPVVLLPRSLIERLDRNQLRAVLLHELIHLRRHDVWVNCAQTLLQIVYWWHPLLWFANARARRVREEAVDDAVMFALNEEAEIYAPTLLEVAKLAFHRPLATLGLVGILESRNALRHRIERLLNFSAPRRVGVSVMSVLGIAAFTALAVPMGEPPARPAPSSESSEDSNLVTFHGKVDPEVFTRNIKARAAGTMHTTNDDLTDILSSILDGFRINCTPPRNVTFDPVTGEVTTRNTPEALQILDSVIRELNLPGGESVLNPPYGLKQVLIEAQFYRMRPDDFARLNLDSSRGHHDRDVSPWWDLSSDEFNAVRQEMRGLGVENISSPRIQTAHGVTASLFVGDKTSSIQLECVPYIHNGSINLTALARTTGKYAPRGGWPDFAGHTNCAIFSRVNIPDGSGIVLRAEHAGTAPENELIILLKGKIVEPATEGMSPMTRGGASAGTTTIAAAPIADDQVKTLVPNGKLLYELGKFDEAETNFKELLNTQPDNQTALYYLSILKQRRIRAAVDSRNAGSNGLKVVPNPYARTNTIYTSAARQKIYEKLNGITFDKISFSKLPLSEVLRNLTEQTQRRDVDQQGINFLLNRAKPSAPADGTNSQPQSLATTSEGVELGEVTISLEPGLKNVRLLDVLEAIVKSSDHPIKYSLLDYGIEFSLKASEPELHTRTFKLDPNTFYMGLQNISTINFGGGASGSNTTNSTGGGSQGSSKSSVSDVHGIVAVDKKSGSRYVTGTDTTPDIQSAVINFFTKIGVKLEAPKSVFFSDTKNTLTVHATDEDLGLIEQAVNTLNIAPPEVTVKVRFVEADDDFLTELFVNGADGVSTNFGWTGILTVPKFKSILKSLESREHATLVNEGAVTTLSGRQANFQVVDVKTVVTNINATETNKSLTYNYGVTEMPFGTTLDLVPTVGPDGYTIHMTLVPTVTEFLGYEDPKDYTKYDNKLKNAKLPLPKSRVRQMSTSAIVWDGQTLVLGNLSDESVVTEPNGAKLREPFKDKKKTQMIIFITPTIIDPSGNRIHSKDYYDGPTF